MEGVLMARKWLAVSLVIVAVLGVTFVVARRQAHVTTVAALPSGVALRPIDGGLNYYASISPKSAWMDQHILLGGWEEQPLGAQDVAYDVAMGNNIYWNLAGNPLDTADCGGAPCRADYNIIRAGGMHASAPETTASSGTETVAYEGTDEPDMNFGPGSAGWDGRGYSRSDCIPSGSQCGYTASNFFYTGQPPALGSPGYPVNGMPITQGFGKGVLFWETDTEAAKFLTYSNTLSADSYWMTDGDLHYPSQGGCALLPNDPVACGGGSGSGLTGAQRALPANYAYDVTQLEQLQGTNGPSKPVTVDVETGCPGLSGGCITPPAMTAAAWHALIAGARGIIWFQHNFAGPCVSDRSFMDGSNPSSPLYNCQQTPGVTLHNMVRAVTAFNTEVSSLNGVLLSPFADGYVSTAGDVSVMAKDDNGQLYVFAGAGKPATPPPANQQVRFTLADGYTGPVTVVGENRSVQAAGGVFTDTFADQNAVHVYQIGTGGSPGPSPSGTTPSPSPSASTPVPSPSPSPTVTTPVPSPTLTPPAPGAPLVGSDVVQPGQDSDAPGMAEALQYTAKVTGTTGSLSIYIANGNSATSVSVGLYSNNRGNPGTLLTEGTITSPQPNAWNTVKVPGAVVMAGKKYWLALLGAGGEVTFRDLAVGDGPTQNSAQADLTALPQNWSTGPRWANSPASLYAAP